MRYNKFGFIWPNYGTAFNFLPLNERKVLRTYNYNQIIENIYILYIRSVKVFYRCKLDVHTHTTMPSLKFEIPRMYPITAISNKSTFCFEVAADKIEKKINLSYVPALLLGKVHSGWI